MADALPVDAHRLQPVPRVPLWSRRSVGFPAVLTPLVGREREIAALLHLLQQPESHLVTLTGPGGVGKTRLALAVADELEIEAEFADGAAFIPLASVSDPAFVLPAIARVLDIRETRERPLLNALSDALRDRRLLLVLDNFEHLLPAAADLGQLLAEAPRLTMLVTSRAPLRLSVEQRVLVPPLALPGLGDTTAVEAVAEYEAVALFIERAQAVKHDFALDSGNATATAEICRRLDGLPLAIELAAAWTHVLPPAALLGRLERRLSLLHGGAEDQPLRLRTMHDAIAWSYDLLSDDEARLFRRLAVFVGGFTLDGAEAIGYQLSAISSMEDGAIASTPVLSPRPPSGRGGSLPDTSTSSITHHPSPITLDLLAALIDKSLVQPAHTAGHEPRYQMLETMREFALERLVGSGETAEIEAKHAAYILRFAEQLAPVLLGPDELYWHARADAELGNLRAALAWALEHDVETALRIGAALWPYWSWYQLAEGRRWLTAALDRSAQAPALVRARALTTDGALAALEGNFAVSFERGSAAALLAHACDDPVAEALARWITACSWFYTEHIEAVLPEMDQALLLFAQASTSTERAWAVFARSTRAAAIALLGDQERGIALYEQALAEARAVGSEGMILALLGDLSGWYIGLGETARARVLLQESLALAAHRNGRWLALYPLLSLALVDAIEGDATTAARRLGAGDTLQMLAGLDAPAHYQERVDRATVIARSALGEERFATLWEAGRANLEAVLAAAAGNAKQDEGAASYGLTRRERDVLRLLADGRTDKEIAATLFVTRRTASKHVAAILAKLGVDSRTAAVGVALRRELLDASP